MFKTYCFSFLLFYSGLSVSLSVLRASDIDWTSFQNGGRLGATEALPTEWSPDSNIAWRVPVTGYGQSTPVVFDGRVMLTSTSGENKDQFHLLAFQLDDGSPLWQLDFANPSPETNNSYVSRAAPTPAVDSRGVYVFFEGGVLAAASPTGTLLWERDLVKDYGPISARHGLASSLEQDENHLFVWVERSDQPYLMAVAKSSGETVWKVAGLGATTWSTPRLIEVGERHHLVCSASGMVAGFDPEDGKRLWTIDDISNNTSCTPIPAGKNRFLIGASDGRGEQAAGEGASSNGVIEIKENPPGDWNAEFVWRAKKATCSFGSPAVFGQSAFIVNRAGVLYTVDLDSGEEQPPQRLSCGSVWATPLIADKKLYLFGQKGETAVIDLTTGKELSNNRLWDPAGSSAEGEPTSSGSVLYAGTAAGAFLLLRSGESLFAIKR